MNTIFGLPVHPLIVHATVVMVPAAALAVLLAALWPRFRRWAGWGPLGLSAAAVLLVPLSTSSGEALEHRLPRSGLIEQHAHLADGLLPWVIALLVGAAALFWTRRHEGQVDGRTFSRWLVVAIVVLIVAAAAGTLVEVVLIGHSGATAAWSAVG
jgi:hypothetical protein